MRLIHDALSSVANRVSWLEIKNTATITAAVNAKVTLPWDAYAPKTNVNSIAIVVVALRLPESFAVRA